MGGNLLGSGVEHGKAAGAVGRLHHAGRETGLPDQGGLLIAGDAANRHRGAQDRGLGQPEIGVAIAHLRQDGARHPEDPQQVLVEGPLGNIIKQGA